MANLPYMPRQSVDDCRSQTSGVFGQVSPHGSTPASCAHVPLVDGFETGGRWRLTRAVPGAQMTVIVHMTDGVVT